MNPDLHARLTGLLTLSQMINQQYNMILRDYHDIPPALRAHFAHMDYANAFILIELLRLKNEAPTPQTSSTEATDEAGS